jgi:hypothetical protein
MLVEDQIAFFDPQVEVLHARLLKLHDELGIDAWIELLPVPSSAGVHQPCAYTLICHQFGYCFASGSLVSVGETLLATYIAMLALCHRELERYVRVRQESIDLAVAGLRYLLRDHD